MDNCKSAEAALEASTEPHHGRCPDALFLCAGQARPKYFIEASDEDMALGMQEGFWAQAWSALVRYLFDRRHRWLANRNVSLRGLSIP